MGAAQFPGLYPGTISAPPDLAVLVRSADVVVLGAVVSVNIGETVDYGVGDEVLAFHRKTATVDPERLLKGVVGDGPVEVAFLEPDVPSGLAALHVGERVVLFLTHDGSRFTLADPVTAKIPMTRWTGADGVEVGPFPVTTGLALRAGVADGDPEVSSIATSIVRAAGE